MEKRECTARSGWSLGKAPGVIRSHNRAGKPMPVGSVKEVEVFSINPNDARSTVGMVTLVTLGDETVLEFEGGDRVRVFWSRKEFDEGRSPITTLWLFDRVAF